MTSSLSANISKFQKMPASTHFRIFYLPSPINVKYTKLECSYSYFACVLKLGFRKGVDNRRLGKLHMGSFIICPLQQLSFE
jgi:hypothetical protein